MSIKIDSTTDSTTAVSAALGDLANKEAVVESTDKKSEVAEKQTTEKADESDSSESMEGAEESDSKDGDEEQKDDKPKKKSGFKKRIDKLNQRLMEKDREAEYWRAKAERPQQVQETSAQAIQTNQTVSADAKPNVDQFNTHAEYVEALTDWKVEQKEKAREAKAREIQAQTEMQKQAASHVERVKSFKEAHEDFDELIAEVDDIPISLTVKEVILGSDNGAELMYELAKNRDEYARICKLSPIAAARELGKFEARIKASESKTETTKTTKAPPPVKPVGSKANATSKSPDEMSYQEFKKWREAQGA